MVGRICHPGEDRVKVSENLGATVVVPVAPVDTFLSVIVRGAVIARTYLQLPLQQWGAGNVYLLVLSS